jgi:hypothetical protein
LLFQQAALIFETEVPVDTSDESAEKENGQE